MLFDQPEQLEPDQVLAWHALCRAGLDQERLKIRACLLNQSSFPSYVASILLGADSDEVDFYFADCRDELDLSAVLTLIAAAEGRIRLDAKRRVDATGNTGANTLAGRLNVLFSDADKDWAVPLYESGIMEAWKSYTATLTKVTSQDQARILTCIGKLKEMLPVRHWVAHGRYYELRGGIKDILQLTSQKQ
ncbi:MAG TPA: hypothetical protein VME69_10785 [Methylocella sp.]|nr:hypothetical protein [Methylocella sp.]